MKKRYERNHFEAFSNSINKKKLYKKGKNWIIGSLTLLALTGMGMTVQQTTHADVPNNKTKSTSVGNIGDIEHKAKAMYTSVVAANITNSSAGKPTQNSDLSYKSNNQFSGTKSAMNSVSSSVTSTATVDKSSTSQATASLSTDSSITSKPYFNSAYLNYMKQMSGIDANVQNANTNDLTNVVSDKNVSNSLLVGTKPKHNLLQDDNYTLTSISSNNATSSADDINWIWYSSSNSSSNGKTVTVNSFIPSSDISESGFIKIPSESDYSTDSSYNSAVSSIENQFGHESLSDIAQQNDVNASSIYANGNSLMSNYNSIPSSDKNKWIYANGSGFYNGTYRYNEALKAIEFLKGNIDDSGKYSEPAFINDAQSIKFDNVIANGYGFNNRSDELNYLFANYSNLKSIDVSGLTMSPSIKYANGMFENNPNLTDIIFSDKNNNSSFNTIGINSMNYMFYGDGNLTSLTLSSFFDTPPSNNISGKVGMFEGVPLHVLTIKSPYTLFTPSSWNTGNGQVLGAGLDLYYPNSNHTAYQIKSPWHYNSPTGTRTNLEDNNVHIGTFYNSDYSVKPNIPASNIYELNYKTSTSDKSDGKTPLPLTNINGDFDDTIKDNNKFDKKENIYYKNITPKNGQYTLQQSDMSSSIYNPDWALAKKNSSDNYTILKPGETVSFTVDPITHKHVANLYVFPKYDGLIYKYKPASNGQNSIEFVAGNLEKAPDFDNQSLDSSDSYSSLIRYRNNGTVQHIYNIKFNDNVTDNLSDSFGLSDMFSGDSLLTNLYFGKNFKTNGYSTSGIFSDATNLQSITIQSSDTRFENTDTNDTYLESDTPQNEPFDNQGKWYGKNGNQIVNMRNQGSYISGPNTWVSSSKLANESSDTTIVFTYNHHPIDALNSNNQNVNNERIKGATGDNIILNPDELPNPKHYHLTSDGIQELNEYKYDNGTHSISIAPNNISYKISVKNGNPQSNTSVINSDTVDGPYGEDSLYEYALPQGYRLNSDMTEHGGAIYNETTNKYQYHIYNTGDNYDIYVQPAKATEQINYVVKASNAIALNEGQTIGSYISSGFSYISTAKSNANFSISNTSNYNIPAGYQIDSGQNTTFNYDNSDKTIYITPESGNKAVDYYVKTGSSTSSLVASYELGGNSYSASGAGDNYKVIDSANYLVNPNDPTQKINYYNLVSPTTVKFDNNNNIPAIVNVTPKTHTDTIYYKYNNHILGSMSATGNSYSAFNRSSDNDVLHLTSENASNMPANYHLVSLNSNGSYVSAVGSNSLMFNYENPMSNSSYYATIAPNTASTTANYVYNGSIITSYSGASFSGNSASALDASDISKEITSLNASGIPQGYHLDINKIDIPYDNSAHAVAIVPDSETLNYKYKDNIIASQTFTGNQFNQNSYVNGIVEAKPSLPKGYHLSNNNGYITIQFNNSSRDIVITPDSANTTINYDYNGSQISSNTVLSSGSSADASEASDTSININNSNHSGIPNGYHLDLNNTNIPYDNANGQNSHQIAIVPDSMTVNYQYNGSTVSTSTYKGNQFSQASLSNNKFTVSPSLADNYTIINGNGYTINKFGITVPFNSGNSQSIDVSLSYNFIPAQTSANTNELSISSANNSLNSNNAWLSQANSINSLATQYANSVNLDTNSSEINFQFGWDNNQYQQISSLAQVISNANTRANSYANNISNASANHNVSQANNDLSNTATELSVANSVTSQASNVLHNMTTVAPELPIGYVHINYINQNSNKIISSNRTSGTVGTAIPLSTLSSLSMSGYIAKSVNTNNITSFADESANDADMPTIDIEMQSDVSDPTVKGLMSSVSTSTSTSASTSASNEMSTAHSVVSVATSQLISEIKEMFSNQSVIDSTSARSGAMSIESEAVSIAQSNATSAESSLSTSDYNSGSSVISDANSIIESLISSASSASVSTSTSNSIANSEAQQGINDVVNDMSNSSASTSKSAQSMAKYADSTEHQAVSQATDNEKSAINSQSSSDYTSASTIISNANSIIASQQAQNYSLSNSASSASTSTSKSTISSNSSTIATANSIIQSLVSLANSASISASNSANTRVISQSSVDSMSANSALNDQNNRDVSEAIYNENYLIGLINTHSNSVSTKSSSASTSSNESNNISSGSNGISSSTSNNSNTSNSSTPSESLDLNSIKTSLSNSASLAVQSVANSASASASKAIASALANSENSNSGTKVVTSVINHTIYVPSVVTKYVGSSTVSNNIVQSSSASVSSSSSSLNLSRRKSLPSHRSAEGTNSIPVNSDLKPTINGINFGAPAISVRNAKQLNGVLNRIDVGQIVNYHGTKISRLRMPSHFRYFMVIKTALAHLRLANVGRETNNRLLRPHHALTIHINRIIVVHGKYGNYVRYEFRANHHNFWVTGRDDYTPNAYLQKGDFANYRTPIVKVVRNCRVYTSPHYNRQTFVRNVHVGTVLPIKRVIFIGHRGDYQTRLQLTNGNYVTANKNFVKVVK